MRGSMGGSMHESSGMGAMYPKHVVYLVGGEHVVDEMEQVGNTRFCLRVYVCCFEAHDPERE